MRCRATRRRLAGYVYGDLSPRESAALEEHVARCAACRGQLDLTRQALGLMPAEPAPVLSEPERAEMMRSVRRAVRTAAAARERTRTRVWSWATAVVVAAALGGGLWYTQHRGPAPEPPVVRRPDAAAPQPGRPRLGPALAAHPEEEPAEAPGASEDAPLVLAVADAEIEFISHTAAQPTVAPIPAGYNDMRMMP